MKRYNLLIEDDEPEDWPEDRDATADSPFRAMQGLGFRVLQ